MGVAMNEIMIAAYEMIIASADGSNQIHIIPPLLKQLYSRERQINPVFAKCGRGKMERLPSGERSVKGSPP